MLPISFFLFASLVLNLFMVLVSVWLLTRYQELSESYHTLRKERERSEKVAEKWLDEARIKSEEIVSDAEERASSLLVESKMINDEMKQKLDDSLMKMTDQISSQVASEMTQEVSVVATKLSAQALSDFAKAKEEIEVYKRAEMLKIGEKVKGIVRDVSLEVLGEALDRADQEEMVRKALEKLPKEDVRPT